MLELAVSFLPFALIAIVLVLGYKLRGRKGLWIACAAAVILLVAVVLAGELRNPYREWPVAASLAMAALVPPIASTAVLITGRLGIGWAGQVIAGFALAWLGLLGIAILLVAVFPGHFFI
jgi:hypothetical protein